MVGQRWRKHVVMHSKTPSRWKGSQSCLQPQPYLWCREQPGPIVRAKPEAECGHGLQDRRRAPDPYIARTRTLLLQCQPLPTPGTTPDDSPSTSGEAIRVHSSLSSPEQKKPSPTCKDRHVICWWLGSQPPVPSRRLPTLAASRPSPIQQPTHPRPPAHQPHRSTHASPLPRPSTVSSRVEGPRLLPAPPWSSEGALKLKRWLLQSATLKTSQPATTTFPVKRRTLSRSLC